MIQDGREKVIAIDTGINRQKLSIIVLSVNDHVFFSEVCEQIMVLANRYKFIFANKKQIGLLLF